MSFGIGSRCSLALLWLWCRLAAAALIQPLAWELPYAMSAALKRKTNKQKNKKKKTTGSDYHIQIHLIFDFSKLFVYASNL